MKLLTGFKVACFGLWTNRLRVLSSMIGVIIGMFSVIVLISVAMGVKDTLMKQMGNLGAEQILVLPGRILDTTNGQKDLLSGLTSVPSTLTFDDVEAVSTVQNVKSVTPYLETINFVEFEEKKVQSSLVGTSDQYSRIQHAELAEGRFFTKKEQENEAKVAVVGANISKALLGQVDMPGEVNEAANGEGESLPFWKQFLQRLMGESVAAQQLTTLVGQSIVINGESFKVIGVLAPNATLGSSTDNNVVMPIETALATTSMTNLTKMIVEASSIEAIDQVDADVMAAVRTNHTEIDFSVVKQEQILGALGKVTSILQLMLLAITVIALLISGFGIMNVMIMSVRERTKEIGIRKALGATNFEIMMQFFFETLLLCVLGGIVGIGLGYAVIEVWNDNIDIFALVLPMWAIEFGLYTSIGIGAIFGIFPALKAARMNPSKALRYE